MNHIPQMRAKCSFLPSQTLFEYLQSPVRTLSTHNYDSYSHDSYSMRTELSCLKIQEMEPDNISVQIPMRKARSLPPIRLSRRQSPESCFGHTSEVDRTERCVHHLTVQHRERTDGAIGKNDVMRKRYLVWVPTRTTATGRSRHQSLPLPNKLSITSRRSPCCCHHIHVALLPNGMLEETRDMNTSSASSVINAHRLPKGKQLVRFRRTPQFFSRHNSNGCVAQVDSNHNSRGFDASISGSSLGDGTKWVSQAKELYVQSPVIEDAPKSIKRPSPVSHASKESQSKRPTPPLQAVAIKNLSSQAEFPITTISRLSLSAELSSGSLSCLVRVCDTSNRTRNVISQGGMNSDTSTSLSRITLPQLPFKSVPESSNGPAISGSTISLNTIRGGFHNLHSSAHVGRATPPSPIVEGTQLSLQSAQKISVVIPSSPSLAPDEDSNDEDGEDPLPESAIMVQSSDGVNVNDFERTQSVSPPPTATPQYPNFTPDGVPATPRPTPVSVIQPEITDAHYLTESREQLEQGQIEIEPSALEESEISTSIGDETSVRL